MAIALYCPLEKYILMSGYEEINGRLTTNPDYTLAVNKAREVCWSKICKTVFFSYVLYFVLWNLLN